jgi:type 2A phosphatase activator TIP41
MPSCFLILMRFFSRLDGVHFKIRDVRFFHDFSTNHVIREQLILEQDYAIIRQVIDSKS